jgi:3D (Asp-Asp-Asp) domain-containing protein
MGRGTKAVVQTETVDGEELQFWRKVSVYATSYHPSIFGPDARTRSGMPLAHGTVAVSAAWYPSMVGQRVYVRGYGYGTIGDSGGGIPGTPWIDLGYGDADYVGWHSWTTIYFLTPIPAWYPAVLP